jgi:hypothetical protein
VNDRDLEDSAGNSSKDTLAPDEQSLGVVAGDIFHVLSPEACGGCAVGKDNFHPEQAMAYSQPLLAGGSGDQFAYGTPS